VGEKQTFEDAATGAVDPKPTIGHLINDRLLPGGSD
jgi:hypothetical protein